MSSAEDAGNKTVASEEEVKLDGEMVKEHPEFADVDEAKRIRFLRVSIYQEYLYKKTLQGIFKVFSLIAPREESAYIPRGVRLLVRENLK